LIQRTILMRCSEAEGAIYIYRILRNANANECQCECECVCDCLLFELSLQSSPLLSESLCLFFFAIAAVVCCVSVCIYINVDLEDTHKESLHLIWISILYRTYSSLFLFNTN